MSPRRMLPYRFSALVAVLVLGLATPALAGYRAEKEFDLAPGGRFVLDSDRGSVTVTGSRSSGVRVVITSKKDNIEDYMKFEFDQSPGEVRVTGEKIKSFSSLFSWGSSHSLRYEVELPRETELEIDTGGGGIRVDGIQGEVQLDTSGGAIRAYDIEGELLAETSGGSITIERIQGNARVSTSGGSINAESIGGALEARTSGGSITIDGVEGDLHAKTSGGTIRIGGAGGRVDASSSGGSVRVQFTSGNFSGGSLSTSGGGIQVAVDPSAGFEVDAHASGGSVHCDFPVTVSGKLSRHTLRGTLGAGGELLRLRTSGGSIRIVEN